MRAQIAGAAAAKAGAVLFSYLVNYTLVLGMSQEGFGRFSFLMSIIAVGTLAVMLGHPQVFIRSAAQYDTGDAERALAGIWRLSFAWIAASGGVAVSAVLIWAHGRHFGPGTHEFVAVALTLPLLATLNMLAALLHGLHRTTSAHVAETVLRPMLLFVAAAVFLAASDMMLDTATAISLNLTAVVVAGLLTFAYLRRVDGFALLRADAGQIETKRWFRASAALSLVGAAHLLLLNVDIIMVGLIRGDAEVATYRIAVLLSMIVASLYEILTVVMRPRIARAHAAGRMAELQRQMRRPFLAALAAGVACLAAFALAGEPLLISLFGEAYAAAYLPTLVLISGQALAIAFGPVAPVLNMTGRERVHLRIIAAALAANVFLNLLLIWPLGNLGAAIASFVALAIWRGVATIMIARQLGETYLVVPWRRPDAQNE